MSGRVSKSPLRPVRVALVAGADTLHRMGPLVRQIVIGLLDEPRPVALVCPETADLAGLPVLPLHVIRYRTPLLPFLRERVSKELSAALAAEGVALLHALDADALALTRSLSYRTNLPYLAGVYTLTRDLHLGEQRCRAVLAGSEPVRRMLLGSSAAASERVHLLRPGVYPARMATCFTDPRHAVAVVASGELRHQGRWLAVLEAFARLRQHRQDCAFFIVGNGRAETYLRRQGQRLDLMPDLSFVDRQSPEGLSDILKAADIFIAPDLPDRVDMEVLAAMASGTPVLAAGGGACDFINPQTSLTFPAGNASALAEAVASLLDDRAAARSLAENALAYLRQHHSPARMVGQLGELYERVAEDRHPA